MSVAVHLVRGLAFSLGLQQPPGGPAEQPTMFGAAGPAAEAIASLGWYLIAMTTLVTLLIVGLILAGIRRGGRGDMREPPDTSTLPGVVRRWVILGGGVFPASVLLITLLVVLATMAAREPHPDVDTYDVDLIGHQWWWEVQYPELGIVSANEIHIPVGQEVRIRLRSADVIHSFWIPQLQGKIDLIPGKRNEIRLQADRPGVFRGACAEYCGRQHAHMDLFVVAHEEDDLERWWRRESLPARVPRDPLTLAGARRFEGSACAYCHTIRGTPARGTIGPDLTHVGSRRMIASVLPNTQAAISGWIANPHNLKPGTLMPPFAIEGEELRALGAYLESLK